MTSSSANNNNLNDENNSNISKQYVSDYILSQPFDSQEDELKINPHGAKKNVTPIIPPSRKRMLPTAHLRQQQQQQQQQVQRKDDSSSEQDDGGALSSPDSTSAIDDNESVPRGRIRIREFVRFFFSTTFRRSESD